MAASPAVSNAQIKNQIWGTASPPSTYDAFFTQAVVQVEAVVQGITGIRFTADDTVYDTVTNEVRNGSGTNIIEAKLKPVITVTKIEIRNASWGWTEQTDISSYGDLEFDGNKIYTKDLVLAAKGDHNVRLTYTVGYRTGDIPGDLQQAIILMVVGLFNQRQSIGLKSQNVMGQLTLSLDDKDFFQVERILKKYKNVIVL